MTIAFAAVIVAILSERVSERIEGYALAPLMLAGLLSVLWWARTGDLRPYILLQVLPLVMLPVVVGLVPGRKRDALCVTGSVAWYVLAKVLELNDEAVYAATRHAISGHSLKHLAAAVGCGILVLKVLLHERRGAAEQGRTPAVAVQVTHEKVLSRDLDMVNPRHR
jgi:hypothetical protein